MITEKFVFRNNVAKKDLGEGISRKVLAHSEKLMMVEVSFEMGSIGMAHSHAQEQASYVLEGVFEFSVDDEKKIIRVGDTVYIAPDLIHSTLCLEKGKLLDVFSPMRKDFV